MGDEEAKLRPHILRPHQEIADDFSRFLNTEGRTANDILRDEIKALQNDPAARHEFVVRLIEMTLENGDRWHGRRDIHPLIDDKTWGDIGDIIEEARQLLLNTRRQMTEINVVEPIFQMKIQRR